MISIKKRRSIYFYITLVCACYTLYTGNVFANPLQPVKTDSPRDTMKTFMSAMNDYRSGMESGDETKKIRIEDALRCFDVNHIPILTRSDSAKESAIYLKEVIDRIIIIKYDFIPGPDQNEVVRWRLKDTEITILLTESGERKGEYLFSQDTANRAKEFYNRVKHLPYLEGSGKGASYKAPWLDRIVPSWTREKYVGLSLWQWLGLAIAILIGLTLKVIIRFLVELLGKLATRTAGKWDDKIIKVSSHPLGWVFAAGFWYASLFILRLEGLAFSAANIFVQIALSFSFILLAYRLVNVLSEFFREKAAQTESTLDDQLVPLLNRTLKILVVILGVLLAIQNLGVNVLSLLAGLGIGGLAFALAAKDAVANFFGSLMILFDRPFQVGDWIVVGGNAEGTVEEIGFRSTRIRTFYDSVISIPNSEVANVKIDNMGMRVYRRIYAILSLKYDTPPEKMEAFLEGVKEIVKANPHTRKDYFHVVFTAYGASSLDVLLYCFLKVPDWSQELVQRQNIYLEILRFASELGVEFAYPSQSLYVENMPEPGKETAKLPAPEKLLEQARAFGKDGKNSRPDGLNIFTPPYKE